LLVKFKSGKVVVFQPNGAIVHQDPEIQKMLDDDSEIIGFSYKENGKKYVVLSRNSEYDIVGLEFNR
jgi:hypothetical protein